MRGARAAWRGGPRGLHEGRRGDGREGERAKERKGGLCGGARAYRRAGGEHEDAKREHDGAFGSQWVPQSRATIAQRVPTGCQRHPVPGRQLSN